MTASTTRLPVTVVTGFLGAGKTTLLRHLLLHSGQRLAVLVNEFGDVGIDGDLIASCGFCPEEERGDRVVELTNGCLCCTVQEDFLPTMEQLLARRDRLDGIVVETSGLALPAPLVAAFGWPSIRPRVRVQAVVTVVDGEALAAGHVVGDADALEAQRLADPSLDHVAALEDLFEDQLQAADLVLVSRSDRVAAPALEALIGSLSARVRPGAGVLPMQRGRIDPLLVLDGQRLTVESKGRDHEDHEGDHGDHQDGEHSQVHGGHGHAHGEHGHAHDDHGLDEHEHEHDHDHQHDHTHADIRSLVLRREGRWDRASLEAWLRKLIRQQPVLRLKGRLQEPQKSLPLQIQAVGPRLECWYEAGGREAGASAGLELVLLVPAPAAVALEASLEQLPPEMAGESASRAG